MDDGIKNSRLYKKIKVSQAVPIIFGAAAFVILLAIEIFWCAAGINENRYGEEGTITIVVVTVFVLIIGAAVYFPVKRTMRMNAQKMKRLNSLSYYDYMVLEEQIEHTELLYKTFYLLEEYMYIPRAKLLIKYTDIEDFQSIIHSTNGIKDGVRVKITDYDGIVYEAVVKKWRQYVNDIDEFVDMLNKKKFSDLFSG